MSPDASACATGPPPRNATPGIELPHWLLSHLRNSSGPEPLPSVPKLKAAGLAATAAFSSATDETPAPFETASAFDQEEQPRDRLEVLVSAS